MTNSPFRSSRALKLFSAVSALLSAALCAAQVSVTTYHNDIARTGLNSAETILTPAKVKTKNFGLLFSLPVDGQVYAQPLYVPQVRIAGKGIHNVLYVATCHNSVYAFDADTPSSPLWHVNFGPSVPNWELGSDDINPEIGITSTPVIGPATYSSPVPLLYVVSKVKTTVNGTDTYTQKLHALDTTSGAERLGGAVTIAGSVPGTGEASVNGVVTFDSRIQHSRSALLLVPPSPTLSHTSRASGTLYVAFASHGDNGPYHGWVFVYDASTLKLLGILNTTPNAKTDPSGYPIAAGGIWQGGAGPASDGTNVFFATGNGTFDPATKAYGDAIVRMKDRTYSIADYFAPSNQLNLDDYDADLGSGAVMLLPASVGSTAHKSLLIHSGKEGTIYLLDRGNLGKYGTTDTTVQELPYVMGGIWGAPAYYNGRVYFGPTGSAIVAFGIANGQFTKTGPVDYTPDGYGYPGPTPSISANGTKDGIVWAISADAYGSKGPAILRAYEAANLANELYDSSLSGGRDTLGGATKFTTPTIVNGKVYVGTSDSIGVFGLGKWVANPTFNLGSGTYANAITVTISDTTPGATIYYTTDGSLPTTASTKYTGAIRVSLSGTLRARAFAPGFSASGATSADYLINPVIGTGTGLLGNYFAGIQDPTGTPTASRIDALLNFDWGGGSPISGVDGNNWAGEWKGQIQAMTTGVYTLYTNTDDGVRVYIDGNLVIDNYTYHAPTIDQTTLNWTAGEKHTIDIKFFQGSGGSVMQLLWSAPAIPRQFVPTTQLYPAKN